MPIPWGSIASAIPWAEVIARAPDVVRGAKKLWQRVGTKTEPGPAGKPPAPTASVEERLAWLEARHREQETRAQEGADLLARLAEQQSGLIAEVARLHRRNRLLWALAIAALALGVTALLIR